MYVQVLICYISYSSVMSNPALKAMSKLCAGKHYDVLDNHADKFSHPTKPNQPRIKQTSTQSHLAKTSSYYQPPRRRKKNLTSTANASATSVRANSPERRNTTRSPVVAARTNRSTMSNEDDSESETEKEMHNKSVNRSQNNNDRSFANRSIQRKSSVDERNK